MIFWPLFLPDLNLIKRVWYIIKNYLQDIYLKVISYNRLRAAIKDAWEKVRRFEFKALIQSIKARYKAIIVAKSRFIKY